MRRPRVRIDDILPIPTWYLRNPFFWAPRYLGVEPVRQQLHLLLRTEIPQIADLKQTDFLSGKVLFFRSLERGDYEVLFQSVRSKFASEAVDCVVQSPGIRVHCPEDLRFVSKWESVRRVFRCMFLGLRYVDIVWDCFRSYGLAGGLYIFLVWLKGILYVEPLLKLRPSCVVVFAEMQWLERTLLWRSKLKRIPTVALQHGLFCEYNRQVTVNSCNYQPRFVDLFLAWGRHTESLVRKYGWPEMNIRRCGKPLPSPSHNDVDKGSNTWVVLMDQNFFKEQNQLMLDIASQAASEMNAELAVKLHPNNRPREYRFHDARILSSDESIYDFPVCIGHTSSILVDVLMADRSLFRLRSDCESVVNEPDIEFENAAELIEQMTRGTSASAELAANYIECAGEEAVERHVAAIRTVVESP